MTAVVTLSGVSKRYRRGREVVTAVDDVSLELWPGSMVALVGPSGSGKTTLLNLILGGDEADAGTIERSRDEADWSQLAIVPQTLGLLPELTLGENVGLPHRLGAPVAADVATVMDRLGIGALTDRPPEETSLGEQQRAAVARALVTAPGLLIADEPTSHQDEANADRVSQALAEAATAGACVLVATHDRRVLDYCSRVLHIRDGRLTRGVRHDA